MQDGNEKPVHLASAEKDELSSVVLGSPDETLPIKKFDSQLTDDDERIVLNVGGVRHETHVATLKKIEKTRLSRLADQHLYEGKDVYFFDRHPAVFNSVIDFYRTGELHVPLEVCGAVVKRELEYWQINEAHIKSCCWRNYRSYIENKRILDSFNHSIVKQQMHIKCDDMQGWERIRTKVWLLLEYPRTSKAAMCYGIISLLFVIASILGFCLETLPDLRPKNVTLNQNQTGKCDGKNVTTNIALTPNEALNYLDYICTAFFTVELIVRFCFSPNKFRFVRSAMNIIDLLALVPLYMQLILSSDEFKFCFANERLVFEIMFILRIIRMFRIFHLVKHYQALQILVYALKASLQELLMLGIFLLIGMLVFATMIYYAERKNATTPGDNFSTIPIGFWWAIITMTTVGYGDVFPTTPIGYIVGTACSVSGVLMVALTIPVISNNFTLFYTHVRSRGPQQSARSDANDINSEILVHSEDGATIYENARRTSNGSIIMNEKSFSIRKPSNGSAVTADAYTNGKLGHNGDIRYGRMFNEPAPKYTDSNSMTNIGLKRDESEIILTRSGSVKAHSDDGVMYSERKNATTPGDNFSTIPIGFWWAIITMTTVGYGDVFPTTPIGYIVGTACSVSGVLMVALTIPVISNNFTLFYTHVRSRGPQQSARSDANDINSEILVHSEDGATIYENTRRTSNGSIIMNEKSFFIRKPSNGSAVTADAYTNGKLGHNGDIRYGRMFNEPAPKYTDSNSMTNIGLKRDESEIILTRSGSVKAHSDDGVMYSGDML